MCLRQSDTFKASHNSPDHLMLRWQIAQSLDCQAFLASRLPAFTNDAIPYRSGELPCSHYSPGNYRIRLICPALLASIREQWIVDLITHSTYFETHPSIGANSFSSHNGSFVCLGFKIRRINNLKWTRLLIFKENPLRLLG